MGSSSVPSIQWNPTGPVAPSQPDILAGIQADMNAAFGGNLNPALETPQGQLASSKAAVVGDANDNILFLSNMFDPAVASGTWQDALYNIYFLERNPAEPTTVSCVCAGANGTVIPTGALAVATDGNLYTCTSGGTISGGSVTLSFACQATGPIACPATSLNQIYRQVNGWDSINNPSDGVPGVSVESRSDFYARYQASVAQNSVGSIPAIRGSVFSVSGIIDCYVQDNSTNSPVTVQGQTIAANSLYVCAAGGSSSDIATAIWKKKSPGCSYTGSTTVTVTDTNPGYSLPYPTYSVSFQIAASLPIQMAVSITNSPAIPSNALALVQAAVVSAFSGGDGGSRVRIGSTIYASRYYPTIASLGTWASEILSILIGSPNTHQAAFTGVLAGTALTVSSVTGTVAIGQTIGGANVLPGTRIISGSGTSWVVNLSQTVSSEAMTGTTPTLTSIVPNINQIPVISAADIVLTLV